MHALLGALVWMGALAVAAFVVWALWDYAGSGPPVAEASHLHPDAIEEVEAILGVSFYDDSWMDPMLGTNAGNAAIAGARDQVIAQVCASRQARGLPTYV